jgi:hypothetical protein
VRTAPIQKAEASAADEGTREVGIPAHHQGSSAVESANRPAYRQWVGPEADLSGRARPEVRLPRRHAASRPDRQAREDLKALGCLPAGHAARTRTSSRRRRQS